MAPKRTDDLLPAAASTDNETQEDDSTSSDEEEEEPQPQQPKSQEKESDDEDDDDDDDDEEEEEEEDDSPPVLKTPSSQAPLKSESSEESDSDCDSDKTLNSPSASAFTVKPIVSKPVTKSPEPKKPTFKSTPLKRPSETGNVVSKNKKSKIELEKSDKGSKNKKSKMINGDEEGGEIEEKKSIVNRLWSEKDEIMLLHGIIDYKAKKGADPNSNLGAFHEFVKDLLSVEFTRSQLSEKIRRVKKKFQNNVERGQNGEDPVFSRPHDCKWFELSKKIWGGEGSVSEVSESKVKSSKKKDKKDGNGVSNIPLKPVGNKEIVLHEEVKDRMDEDKEEEIEDFWSLYPRLCQSLESDGASYLTMPKDSKEYVKEIISAFGKDKARELEEGWKGFRVMEYQLYAKRVELIRKQTEAVLDVIKP